MAYKIEVRVGIAAPVDDVYDVVADIENWPSWSPIHKQAAGTLGFGAPMTMEEYFEGLGTWETAGAVSDWTPLSHIHISVPKPFYAGTLIRYYEFEALSNTGTAFSLGAHFNGFLSEKEGRRFAKFIRPGFEKMAEALKAKVEAEFAANPDKPRAAMPPIEPPVNPYVKPEAPWSAPKTWKFGATK